MSVATSFIYRDPAMAEIAAMAEKIAPSTASVLLTGQSGTGKDVLARHIHECSPRAGGAFVSVHCAAIPEMLLETELFGHEKGAFTGAPMRPIGKFEEARGGTIQLDEISEMAPGLQAKLLRVLQEREIERVGGGQKIALDVRVIATSNRDLAAAVADGRFRADLFYRLNVVSLHLPPLAARPGDIAPLAEHFAARFARQTGVAARRLSPSALARLSAYSWPGNVRELENAVQRALILSDGETISADDLRLGDGVVFAPATFAGEKRGDLVGRSVAEVERELILGTLAHCRGNRTYAAELLGISVRTLRNKIRQYLDEGVSVPSYSRAA